MVPFIKASAEANAQKAKVLAEDAYRMQHFPLPANDTSVVAPAVGKTEAKAANE